jgi:hypothetical protein
MPKAKDRKIVGSIKHGCQAYTFGKSRSDTILLICLCGSLSTV